MPGDISLDTRTMEEEPVLSQMVDDSSDSRNLVEQDKKPVNFLAIVYWLDLRAQRPVVVQPQNKTSIPFETGTAVSHSSLLKSLDFC